MNSTSDASDLHLTICGRSVVVFHEQILRLTLQGQIFLYKYFKHSTLTVNMFCSFALHVPFSKPCPNIDLSLNDPLFLLNSQSYDAMCML